jgi:hypothetical protein
LVPFITKTVNFLGAMTSKSITCFYFKFHSRFFTKMPSEHYMGVAHLLLDVAGEDIRDADRIRTAIKVKISFLI